MNAVEVFTNGEYRVRTMQDTDGVVWFVARDVAEALEYSAATVNNNISRDCTMNCVRGKYTGGKHNGRS